MMHVEKQHPDGKQRRAEVLSEWAKEKFGLTASVSDAFEGIIVNEGNTPCRIRFTDVNNNNNKKQDDVEQLMKFCQVHKCSGFCMKHSNGSKK